MVADTATAQVTIRLGNGDGTFQQTGTGQPVSGPYSAVAAGDYTGDGELDVLVRRGTELVVLRGAGDGTLLPGVATRPTIGAILTFATADMNNDGRTDVVFRGSTVSGGGRSGIPPVVTHYLVVMQSRADGSGSFDRTYTAQVGVTGSHPQTPPMSFHVGDFNGDGKQDVMTVAASAAKSAYPSRLLLGTGTDSLTVGNTVKQFVNVNLAVADLNADGKADVIRDNGIGTSTAFLGKGDGKFTQQQTIALAGPPVMADVNGDGRRDLIALDSDAGTVKVFLGNGNGTFKAPRTFAAGPAPLGVVFVGDANADGRPDLFLNTGAAQTTVLLNDGVW